MLFHGENSSTNARQCYATHTLPVLLFRVICKLEHVNFSELHNNIVERVLIFWCDLHLCQLSSATSLCRIFGFREFETVLNFTQFFVILPVC